MTGITINGPISDYGDNQSILSRNIIGYEFYLKKKSNGIACHFDFEGISRDEWRNIYIKTNGNTSDILTKPLPSGEKKSKICGQLLYHLYNVPTI